MFSSQGVRRLLSSVYESAAAAGWIGFHAFQKTLRDFAINGWLRTHISKAILGMQCIGFHCQCQWLAGGDLYSPLVSLIRDVGDS